MLVSTDAKPVAFSLSIGSRTITAADLPELLERYQLMPQLLRELIVDEAIADIPCEAAEMDAAFQQLCQRHQIGNDEEAIQAWLQKQHITLELFKARLARSLRIDKYKEATWGPKLKSIFLERKAQFDKAIYSLIRTPDPYVAQELYFRLQEDEQSFAALAGEYSQGPEAKTGGMVGPVPLGNLHPALVQVLASSQPGQLMSPLHLDKWYIIVRLEQFLPAKLDDVMQKTLLKQLFDDWLKERVALATVQSNGTSPEPQT
ncbi:peptidylprolyl isomerase [Synechococcus sp. PCC 7336]|uniref:peptidylprolyl isomerase n=1 Tax=Synechococcus sp. PCC 7336 TaxID=195250 RepID=UPI000375B179|nr:peptidylprolyl isomerase [Synechococcus sp. PCC 7336]